MCVEPKVIIVIRLSLISLRAPARMTSGCLCSALNVHPPIIMLLLETRKKHAFLLKFFKEE